MRWFLIGIVRERLHQPGAMMAGVRTHTVAALMGAVAFSLGAPVFAIAVAMTGVLIAVGYFRSYSTDPGITAIACASALLSTLASLILFALVLGASSIALLKAVAIPLLVGSLSLLTMAVLLFKQQKLPSEDMLSGSQDAFQLKHVFIIALSISSISLASAWIGSVFGQTGTLISVVIIGFAEIHAAAFSLSQLTFVQGDVTSLARWGVIAILASSVLAKSALSVQSGGKFYGLRMTGALTIFIVATAISLLI